MTITDVDVTLLERLERTFAYHPPTEGQVERYKEIRETAKDFAELLIGVCPESRERSLAMTKLEEVVFWANAGIARNEPS
jgi:hypothetical protein